ncbi:MAG TPA: RNA polymerase sigma factor [Chitinophagaceae bacterium]|nr:RNA polymerase sigma factor [Chitinophagaceae bacterium]
MHSDKIFLTYLKENDIKGINEIYLLFAGKVKGYILNNSGNADDAADIFQEALIDIFHLANKPDFVLTCPFEAFLFIICKRKWLNELKKRSQKPVTELHDYVSYSEDSVKVVEVYANQIEEEHTIMAILETMGDRCKSIIKACMGTDSQSIIAEKLGLSYAYLRKKKSECMSQLRNLVADHPVFKNK